MCDRLRVAGRGSIRAEDVRGTPTQSYTTEYTLAYEDRGQVLNSVEAGVREGSGEDTAAVARPHVSILNPQTSTPKRKA